MLTRAGWTALLAAPIVVMIAATAHAGPGRLIIKHADEAAASSTGEWLRELRREVDPRLSHVRALATGAQVVEVPEDAGDVVVEMIIDRLRQREDVRYVERDRVLRAQFVPNDKRYGEQWYLFEEIGGMRVQQAWDRTRGDADVVVAVLDTGELPHRDLPEARTLDGHDFISDEFMANDGNGRDPDESDPGDWVTQDEIDSHSTQCDGAEPRNSSWHGTRATGLIGAATDNDQGIAGIDHRLGILPVRVLGKCGGLVSDIIDAMVWASGGDVGGAPDNANPADVINLSLSGDGSCRSDLQAAIDQVRARGATVVASAGNNDDDGGDTVDHTPANCDGVITVAATDRAGNLASYSNAGEEVTISAPGGGDSGLLLTTSNDGSQEPGDGVLHFVAGTSFASASVSGVISLIHSAQPGLDPDQIAGVIRDSARPIPGTGCGSGQCGAGLVDADAAVARAMGVSPGSEANPDDGGGGGGGAFGGLSLLVLAAFARCRPRRSRR